jgi:hypothetical protein
LGTNFFPSQVCDGLDPTVFADHYRIGSASVHGHRNRGNIALSDADDQWRRSQNTDINPVSNHGIAHGLARIKSENRDVNAIFLEHVFSFGHHANAAPRGVLKAEAQGLRIGAGRGDDPGCKPQCGSGLNKGAAGDDRFGHVVSCGF